MEKGYAQRIVSRESVRGDEPFIKETRIPVSVIVTSIAHGLTEEDILQEYPQLIDDDISVHPTLKKFWVVR
jgi:uncharacterized protein (DUF433 family)